MLGPSLAFERSRGREAGREVERQFYKPVIAGVRRLHQLPSTIVHQQKKGDMLREWSTMGVSESSSQRITGTIRML